MSVYGCLSVEGSILDREKGRRGTCLCMGVECGRKCMDREKGE